MSYIDKNNSNSSILELIKEIAQLTILLIWKLSLKTFKFLLKLCKRALNGAKAGILKCRDYWNDNSTQTKIRKARIGLRKAASCTLSALKRVVIILIKLIAHFIKYSIQTILHLGPALKKLMKALCNCAKRFKKWAKKACLRFRIYLRRKKGRYNEFRRHKGFKGLLMDMNRSLKENIKKYMDEEQTETDNDVPDEDERINKMLQIEENSSKAEILGKKIFSSVKDIVEHTDEEDSQNNKGHKK